METSPQISLLSTLLPLIGILFIVAVGVVLLNQHFQKNLYRQKLEKEEIKNLHQQDLLRSSILVQEQERKRIAQDIHDELGALLSISRMHLVQLEETAVHNHDRLLQDLQNIRSLTEKAISSMRRISHELMPAQLEAFGLVTTLESVAAHANKTGGISIRIIAEDHLPELTWPVKLGLYRINMELINNTIRHAQADRITISFKYTGTNITCLYTDNGKGLQQHEKKRGLGHQSMEGRANSLGGTISFANIHTGFQATLSIPVTGQQG